MFFSYGPKVLMYRLERNTQNFYNTYVPTCAHAHAHIHTHTHTYTHSLSLFVTCMTPTQIQLNTNTQYSTKIISNNKHTKVHTTFTNANILKHLTDHFKGVTAVWIQQLYM